MRFHLFRRRPQPPTLLRPESRLLNLGCGTHFHPAWVNVDLVATGPSVIVHDLNQPLPFPGDYFQCVYSSHVLEHLPRERAPLFLRECYRVLAADGIIRLAVPDLETIARLYLQQLEGALRGDPVARERYEWIIIELLDQMIQHHNDGGEILKHLIREPIPAFDFVVERFGHEVTSKVDDIHRLAQQPGWTAAEIDARRWPPRAEAVGRHRLSGMVHQWMYDRYSLGQLLTQAGFRNPAVKTASESGIPNFASYQLDVLADGQVRKPDSLFMEATK